MRACFAAKKREKRENSNLPVKKATTAQRKNWGFRVNDGLSRQKEEGRLEIYEGGGGRKVREGFRNIETDVYVREYP